MSGRLSGLFGSKSGAPASEAPGAAVTGSPPTRAERSPNNRTDAVVAAIVESVRATLRAQNVSFEEYRMAMQFLARTAEAKEIPLLVDVFFNTTIVENSNKNNRGSPNDLQGPYFIEDVPFVETRIKTMEQFDGEPMMLRGRVTDVNGHPVEGATMWIWSSTPDGKYGGFHDNIPPEYYRGRVKIGADGRYQIESTTPVPYQIPNKGPVGALLEAMGRHSWRPAHVHYKIRKPGFKEITTQAYFEGGEWVGDDSCEGMHTRDFVIPERHEDGKRIVEIDFILDADAQT